MSKSSDQIVLERRLKPIYDAVDAGNNKKAIQEADKVLKKHPNTHCAKVLKALALIRAERVSEAWPLITEVESLDEDFDENTLQALGHCFKVNFFIQYIFCGKSHIAGPSACISLYQCSENQEHVVC
ncbi:unnamed protein product [Gongylonema pulchrum]|uniref:N-terminal acetyltransferase B complex subunit MDM20 homolog n=1 Tax=Gongylonema pulchrum TaxID=637853 RepID=A0A183E9M0_9BILA|nr:unnamed protein product [Gongylonema pulchrum]